LSFQDSNGDGMGDLPGIAARLEYVSWLGIGAVWLSPTHHSDASKNRDCELIGEGGEAW
jgi:glycosidase